MNSNNPIPTEEEALARIERAMQALAKRGIVYTGPHRHTEDFTAGETNLFGPTTELEYQRLLKELKEHENDTDA